MTWEQKFSEVFPHLDQSTILAGQDGILSMYRDYFSNLQTAIVNKDRTAAQCHYNQNFERFQAYKKAWKLYKKYPGPKQTIPTGNRWSDANISWNGDQLRFPVPRDMEINVYLLKASRMLAHWEVRLTKGYRNAEVRLKSPDIKNIIVTDAQSSVGWKKPVDSDWVVKEKPVPIGVISNRSSTTRVGDILA